MIPRHIELTKVDIAERRRLSVFRSCAVKKGATEAKLHFPRIRSQVMINSIADLRALAKRRIPHAIFDNADGGSYDELTIARNRCDLDRIEFRQRVMRDLSHLSVASTMLGDPTLGFEYPEFAQRSRHSTPTALCFST